MHQKNYVLALLRLTKLSAQERGFFFKNFQCGPGRANDTVVTA